MRFGPGYAIFSALLVQVVLALEPRKNDGERIKRHADDGRIGGFGKGVGPIDMSLGAHPSLLEEMKLPLPEAQPLYQNSPPEHLPEEPPSGPAPDAPPPLVEPPLDQNPSMERGEFHVSNNFEVNNQELENNGPAAQMQANKDTVHDCTVILLERLNKRCCRLPVLVPQKVIDNCTIRDDVSPEYSKRFKVKRGPRMSEDGALDILQITVQLEAAASEAWKPMIRESILACNDKIAAKIPDVSSKVLQTLSGQNCSNLPWVMLKCLKKTFFMACPDVEVIKKDNDCGRDMSRLQNCNPFILTNTSGVKPASRPETAANDAFELLKPPTEAPNATSTGSNWALRKDGFKDRRFDLRRNSPSTTPGYGLANDKFAKRGGFDIGRGGQLDMDTGSSNMSPWVRSRNLPGRSQSRDNGRRTNNNQERAKNEEANSQNSDSIVVENPLAGASENLEVQPNQNRRMDEGDEGREELIYTPSSTVLYEKVPKPINPRRFNGESELDYLI